MKTGVSIAFGVAALAAAAFVALRPSEAYANLDQVKQALKKVKNVHAVSTVRKGEKTVTQEAWVRDGNLRIDVAGKPAKLVKGSQTFVWTTDKTKKEGEGIWEVSVEPTFEGEATFVVLDGGPALKPSNKQGVMLEFFAVESDDVLFRVVGVEELDGQKAEKAIMHKPGDPYRTVMWLDPVTKLPIQAERQKLNGKIWDVVSQVKYDFTKPIPPDVFEPAKK